MCPGEFRTFDECAWIRERRSLALEVMGILPIIYLALPGVNAATTYQQVWSSLFMSLYFAIIVLVALAPKYILSGVLTGLGSVSLFLSVMVISLENRYLMGSIVFLILVYLIYAELVTELNFVQMFALKFIEPERILVPLRTQSEAIRDKIEALQFLAKLHEEEKYGVENALASEFVRRNNSPGTIILGAIIGITLFVFGAIGEGLIQDLVNDDIKRKLCEHVGFYCS